MIKCQIIRSKSDNCHCRVFENSFIENITLTYNDCGKRLFTIEFINNVYIQLIEFHGTSTIEFHVSETNQLQLS